MRPHQLDYQLNGVRLTDMSYQLNRKLWDQYFISTVPSDSSLDAFPLYESLSAYTWTDLEAGTLANSRIRLMSPKNVSHNGISDVRNVDTAAAFLGVKGAFNVNSTSVAAWKAVLGALSNQSIEVYDWHKGTVAVSDGRFNAASKGYPMPRISYPASLPEGDLDTAIPMLENVEANKQRTNLWNGFRSLSDAELTALAQSFVDVVKKRGPFRSLEDYINRQAGSSGMGDVVLRGAIEQALRDSGINSPELRGSI